MFSSVMECFSGFENYEIEHFFFYKFCNFFQLTFVVIKVFQPSRKSLLGFDNNKLLESVLWPWISIQLFLPQILAVFFLNFLSF